MTDASSVTVQQVCRAVGMSRANFYMQRKARRRREVDEALVLERVHRERRVQSQLGLRELLHLIGPDLADAGVKIGRDRFRDLSYASSTTAQYTHKAPFPRQL